jgi:uncharacterized protein Yka (UPF0111/DUF47 family)
MAQGEVVRQTIANPGTKDAVLIPGEIIPITTDHYDQAAKNVDAILTALAKPLIEFGKKTDKGKGWFRVGFLAKGIEAVAKIGEPIAAMADAVVKMSGGQAVLQTIIKDPTTGEPKLVPGETISFTEAIPKAIAATKELLMGENSLAKVLFDFGVWVDKNAQGFFAAQLYVPKFGEILTSLGESSEGVMSLVKNLSDAKIEQEKSKVDIAKTFTDLGTIITDLGTKLATVDFPKILSLPEAVEALNESSTSYVSVLTNLKKVIDLKIADVKGEVTTFVDALTSAASSIGTITNVNPGSISSFTSVAEAMSDASASYSATMENLKGILFWKNEEKKPIDYLTEFADGVVTGVYEKIKTLTDIKVFPNFVNITGNLEDISSSYGIYIKNMMDAVKLLPSTKDLKDPKLPNNQLINLAASLEAVGKSLLKVGPDGFKTLTKVFSELEPFSESYISYVTNMLSAGKMLPKDSADRLDPNNQLSAITDSLSYVSLDLLFFDDKRFKTLTKVMSELEVFSESYKAFVENMISSAKFISSQRLNNVKSPAAQLSDIVENLKTADTNLEKLNIENFKKLVKIANNISTASEYLAEANQNKDAKIDSTLKSLAETMKSIDLTMKDVNLANMYKYLWSSMFLSNVSTNYVEIADNLQEAKQTGVNVNGTMKDFATGINSIAESFNKMNASKVGLYWQFTNITAKLTNINTPFEKFVKLFGGFVKEMGTFVKQFEVFGKDNASYFKSYADSLKVIASVDAGKLREITAAIKDQAAATAKLTQEKLANQNAGNVTGGLFGTGGGDGTNNNNNLNTGGGNVTNNNYATPQQVKASGGTVLEVKALFINNTRWGG